MKNFTQVFKTAIAAIVLLLAFTTTASAQSNADKGAVAVTAQMKKELSLNDSQYNKVLQINRDYLNSIAKAKKTEKSVPVRNKRIKMISSSREKKLKSVLTDGQYRTYAATRATNQEMLEKYYK